MHTRRILHHTCLTVNYCLKSIIIPSLYQRTPLHIAAREGNDDTVKFLVKKGAKINDINVDGVSVTIALMVD